MMNKQQPEYPALSKSYKGMFPFKICTTSFVYPDHYIPNVKMLGPYMDEIELLLFESTGPDVLPSRFEITELGRLAAEFDLSYNIHLPTDISISDMNTERQRSAVETMVQVIELVEPLCPSALILHVPYIDGSLKDDSLSIWQDRVYKNLEKILSVVENKKIIAIETLEYPLELLEAVIVDLDLAICLDLGHLMVYDNDVKEVFKKYSYKTSVLHLHGVENNRDHMTLKRLSPKLIETVLWVLKRFSGVVSIEVFSYEDLISSLKFLENHWERGYPLIYAGHGKTKTTDAD
ncbi:MAG: cobamide remodeling phosphodiesterase CbiR [Desulfobacterales bacterium]